MEFFPGKRQPLDSGAPGAKADSCLFRSRSDPTSRMEERRATAVGGARRARGSPESGGLLSAVRRPRGSNGPGDRGVSNKSDIFALFATGPLKLGLYKHL